MGLYEMATGVVPFSGDTTSAVFEAILNTEPQPADDLKPDLLSDVAGIVA